MHAKVSFYSNKSITFISESSPKQFCSENEKLIVSWLMFIFMWPMLLKLNCYLILFKALLGRRLYETQ